MDDSQPTFVSSRHSENALSIMTPSSPHNKPTLDDIITTKTSPSQLNLCTYTVSSNFIKEFFDDVCCIIYSHTLYYIYRQGKIKED